jgi:hypothetical protein
MKVDGFFSYFLKYYYALGIDKDRKRKENSTRLCHGMAKVAGKAVNANEPELLLFLIAQTFQNVLR